MDGVIIAYLGAVALLAIHGAHRLFLAAAAGAGADPAVSPPGWSPRITVQLPLFNERDVAARLVRAAAALRWPRERLQIQILDDSTDDTLAAAMLAVEEARAAGVEVEIRRRADRAGFKAGALAAGLAGATGELIAIFDADFVPDPGFLERLAPHFTDPRVGMVQGRWGHLNAGRSALTRAQAWMLDAHFCVEHAARHRIGAWFHFNGTGGIWRRDCIEAAGGWQHDTLTEDLDLSYRAQLAGWRFVYRVDEVVPGELPESFGAFLSQQARWARGSIQTLRKLGGPILRGPVPWHVKAEALSHLGANLAWLPGLLIAALLPPVVRAPWGVGGWALDMGVFALSTGANVVYYLRAGALAGDGPGLRRLPVVLALGIAMSVNQAASAIRGLGGATGEFVRTPKGGAAGSYRAARGWPAGRAASLVLGIWSLIGAWWAIQAGRWGALPFESLFAAGFLWASLAPGRGRG